MAIYSVFLLWHSVNPDDDDNTKLLGGYSSRPLAADRIERSRSLPGFAGYPDGFMIDEYQVDKDQWTGGFVEIDPDAWIPNQDPTSAEWRPSRKEATGSEGNRGCSQYYAVDSIIL